jgi:hypothetical protein
MAVGRAPADVQQASGLADATRLGHEVMTRPSCEQTTAFPCERERSRAQMLSPALAEIIGARRLWTVSMISAVSMPSRSTDVTPRLTWPSWRGSPSARHLCGPSRRRGRGAAGGERSGTAPCLRNETPCCAADDLHGSPAALPASAGAPRRRGAEGWTYEVGVWAQQGWALDHRPLRKRSDSAGSPTALRRLHPRAA